jgi:NAD(P)-dependent dehydrogenase (short-subunit alcohol dehydrogenase family)
MGVIMDVVEACSVNGAVEQAASRYGRIDVAVANAGMGLLHAPNVAETSGDDLNRVFAVNVQAAFNTCRPCCGICRREDR